MQHHAEQRKRPGVPTCKRRRALWAVASEGDGSARINRLSEVAMSLKGMPTTSFAPRALYIASGRSNSCSNSCNQGIMSQ